MLQKLKNFLNVNYVYNKYTYDINVYLHIYHIWKH